MRLLELGLVLGDLGLHEGEIEHRHAAPAERRQALLDTHARGLDGRLDRLGLERDGARLVGHTDHEIVGGHGVAKQPFGQCLTVQIDVVGGTGHLVDARGEVGHDREHGLAVLDHQTGRRLRGGDHRDGAIGQTFVQVLGVGRVQDVEAQVQIGAAVGDLVVARVERVGDLDVGNHRAALLRQAGLVQTHHMLAFQPRGVGQRGHHRDRAGAANTHDVDVEANAVIDFVDRGGQLTVERRDATLLLFLAIGGRGRIGGDGQERGAEALDAAEILVAGSLVNTGLAAEFGLHRLHAHAVGLDTAIATAFTDALVDDRHFSGFLGLATAACTAQFGGAFLIVDQHGGARYGGQHALGFVQTVAVPDFGATWQTADQLGAVAGDEHLLDAVGQQVGHQLGQRLLTLNGLTTGHGGVGVAQQLEGDVGVGAGAVANRQAARVGVSAITHVLEDVLGVGERRHADPLRTLGAHVGAHDDIAIHPHGHGVAANAGRDDAAFGRHRGAVVRAARAVPGGAGGGIELGA